MNCHHHVGRAEIFKHDCVLRAIEGMKGKDCEEAVELWEALTDPPLRGGYSKNFPALPTREHRPTRAIPPTPGGKHDFSAEAVAFFPVNEDPLPRGKDEEHTAPHPSSSISEDSKSPTPVEEEANDAKNLSAAPSSTPSSEEKKLASAPVVTPTVISAPPPADVPPAVEVHIPSMDDASFDASASVELLTTGVNKLRTVRYIIFSEQLVIGDQFTRSLFGRFLHYTHIAQSKSVELHNLDNGFVTGNILQLAQKQISVTKYFWQSWSPERTDHTMEVTMDSISLFANSFTHAAHADVYEELAQFVLTHPAFTKSATKILAPDGSVKDTIELRATALIADHPFHCEYAKSQKILSNTMIFISNQLLLRGLIAQARRPGRISPTIVDFRKGAVSKTSLSFALPSKFPASNPPLNLSIASMAHFAW